MISFFLRHIIRLKFLIRLKNCSIHPKSTVYRNSSLGEFTSIGRGAIFANSTLGDYSYISSECFINNVSVGKYCSIGPNVKMGLGEHPVGLNVSTSPFFYLTKISKFKGFVRESLFEPYKRINVGNDVWVGANVVVMDGVKIGDGAILAAGAIIVKDVAPYTIVGGVPAKEIRKRFTKEQSDKLLDLKWWDKDIDWIKENIVNFNSVEDLINNNI